MTRPDTHRDRPSTVGTPGSAGNRGTAGSPGAPGALGIAGTALTGVLIGVLIGVAVTATTPVTGITEVGAVVSVGLPFARAVIDTAAVVTIGLALLPLLVGRRRSASAGAVLAGARRGVVAAALVWATGALVALVLRTAEYRPDDATVSLADIRSYVGAVDAGAALAIVAGLALVQTGVGLLAVRRGERIPAEVGVGIGVFALLPLPVTGHAATRATDGDVLTGILTDAAMVSMELHVISVVAWTGGLGATVLFLAGHRALLAHTLPRFSRLATACLAVAATTGVVSAVAEFVQHPTAELWPGLLTTSYGRLLLVKLAALAVIAALGGYTRLRLLPLIARHRHTGLAVFAAAELAVMGLALGIAAVLSRTPLG